MLGLFGSSSKGGQTGGIKDGECFKLNICPDLLIAAIALAATLAFVALFQAITMVVGRKRRKRNTEQSVSQGEQRIKEKH